MRKKISNKLFVLRLNNIVPLTVPKKKIISTGKTPRTMNMNKVYFKGNFPSIVYSTYQ